VLKYHTMCIKEMHSGYNNFNCFNVGNIVYYSSLFQNFFSIYIPWSLETNTVEAAPPPADSKIQTDGTETSTSGPLLPQDSMVNKVCTSNVIRNCLLLAGLELRP